MRTKRKSNLTARYISCIFMMLALAWLTISLPLVYSAQQLTQEKTSKTQQPTTQEEESSDNPLTNTTEEKTPGNSSSFSEEYLHDANHSDHFTTELSIKYHIEHYSTYVAFYGDLETPPPDQA